MNNILKKGLPSILIILSLIISMQVSVFAYTASDIDNVATTLTYRTASEDTINEPDEENWYKIYISNSVAVKYGFQVAVRNVPKDVDILLSLYKNNESTGELELVTESNLVGSGGIETVRDTSVNETGWYYIKVSSVNGTYNSNENYKIIVDSAFALFTGTAGHGSFSFYNSSTITKTMSQTFTLNLPDCYGVSSGESLADTYLRGYNAQLNIEGNNGMHDCNGVNIKMKMLSSNRTFTVPTTGGYKYLSNPDCFSIPMAQKCSITIEVVGLKGHGIVALSPTIYFDYLKLKIIDSII